MLILGRNMRKKGRNCSSNQDIKGGQVERKCPWRKALCSSSNLLPERVLQPRHRDQQALHSLQWEMACRIPTSVPGKGDISFDALLWLLTPQTSLFYGLLCSYRNYKIKRKKGKKKVGETIGSFRNKCSEQSAQSTKTDWFSVKINHRCCFRQRLAVWR